MSQISQNKISSVFEVRNSEAVILVSIDYGAQNWSIVPLANSKFEFRGDKNHISKAKDVISLLPVALKLIEKELNINLKAEELLILSDQNHEETSG